MEVVADPVRLGILRSLSRVNNATTATLGVEGASRQTLRRHLRDLVHLGVVTELPAETDGETPGRPATRYSLPRETRQSVISLFG